MKHLFFSLIFILAGNFLTAQETPVKWSFTAEKVTEQEYNLVIIANIESGWSVYSQYLESDDGPVKTKFEFQPSKNVELVGQTAESGNKKESYDELFGMNLIKFSQKAQFTQRVKVIDASEPVSGFVTYMSCDETSCLPPTDVDFSISLR